MGGGLSLSPDYSHLSTWKSTSNNSYRDKQKMAKIVERNERVDLGRFAIVIGQRGVCAMQCQIVDLINAVSSTVIEQPLLPSLSSAAVCSLSLSKFLPASCLF